MKKLFALILALVMSLSLVACGGGEAEAPAVEEPSYNEIVTDAFNSAADAFDTAANAVNEDIDAYPQELIDVMNEMAAALLEVKEILEDESIELTEEQANEFVSNLNDIQTWSEEVYADLENMTIEATTVDTSYEAVVEAFNYVSPRFDAVSAYVNEHIEDFDDEFIDGMIEIAEGMIGFKEVLESSSDLSEEDATTILESLYIVDEWLTNEGEALLG